MVSAITCPFIYFIVVIPATRLQNSPETVVNQIPLHRKGEQAKQTPIPTPLQEENAFCSRANLVTAESPTPQLCKAAVAPLNMNIHENKVGLTSIYPLECHKGSKPMRRGGFVPHRPHQSRTPAWDQRQVPISPAKCLAAVLGNEPDYFLWGEGVPCFGRELAAMPKAPQDRGRRAEHRRCSEGRRGERRAARLLANPHRDFWATLAL